MNYEWDKTKAQSNLRKHSIDFADAVIVLEDEFAITIEDTSQEEQRFITIGMDGEGKILLVVYTWHKNFIRIISARKATKKEQKQYEEKR